MIQSFIVCLHIIYIFIRRETSLHIHIKDQF